MLKASRGTIWITIVASTVRQRLAQDKQLLSGCRIPLVSHELALNRSFWDLGYFQNSLLQKKISRKKSWIKKKMVGAGMMAQSGKVIAAKAPMWKLTVVTRGSPWRWGRGGDRQPRGAHWPIKDCLENRGREGEEGTWHMTCVTQACRYPCRRHTHKKHG